MTSILMNYPGWAGRAMRIMVSVSLVVVLIVEVNDFSFGLIDPEGEAPIPRHTHVCIPVLGSTLELFWGCFRMADFSDESGQETICSLS